MQRKLLLQDERRSPINIVVEMCYSVPKVKFWICDRCERWYFYQETDVYWQGGDLLKAANPHLASAMGEGFIVHGA